MVPRGQLDVAVRAYDPAALVAQAEATRSDITEARAAVAAAQARRDLAVANRRTDVTVGAGWTHAFAATGAYAAMSPTPAVDLVGFSLSFPLPFSRLAHHGELEVAIASGDQARAELRAVELAARVEIQQAVTRYNAAVERLRLYTGGILADADKALDAVTYNYAHGGATLLEVLEAQRTVDGVYLAYDDALASHVHALVAVELAAGTWTVKL